MIGPTKKDCSPPWETGLKKGAPLSLVRRDELVLVLPRGGCPGQQLLITGVHVATRFAGAFFAIGARFVGRPSSGTFSGLTYEEIRNCNERASFFELICFCRDFKIVPRLASIQVDAPVPLESTCGGSLVKDAHAVRRPREPRESPGHAL